MMAIKHNIRVSVQAPPGVPPFEFLSKRVNTKIYYCANIESSIIDNETTILTLAKGYLHLIISESVKQLFSNVETLLVNKNVCVEGELFSYNDAFAIVINDPTQISLSGH